MNAQTEIQPYVFDPSTFYHAAYHGFSPTPGSTRHEGWSPDKQRHLLEALSEGHNIIQSCAIVGLSKQSAYALRDSLAARTLRSAGTRRCSMRAKQAQPLNTPPASDPPRNPRSAHCRS